jgi:hypothetical protein
MPRTRKIEPFFIVVTDRDKKVFNLLGPMSDDTQINHRVVQCQEKGRAVNCHTAGDGQSRQQIIASCTTELGLTYTDEPIAV